MSKTTEEIQEPCTEYTCKMCNTVCDAETLKKHVFDGCTSVQIHQMTSSPASAGFQYLSTPQYVQLTPAMIRPVNQYGFALQQAAQPEKPILAKFVLAPGQIMNTPIVNMINNLGHQNIEVTIR